MAKKGIGWIAAAGAAAAGSAVVTAASRRVFRTTVVADAKWTYGGSNKKAESGKDPLARYGSRPQEVRDWYKAQEMEDVWLKSSVDDTRLHARYFPCGQPKRLILCAPGYRTNAVRHFSVSAQWLHETDSSLLFIDERACGESEGRYITFGAREKYDVLDWLDWLNERNPEKLPLYMYGISMGATAVMCASEYVLPDNLAGMIADCGFTSMKDICSVCLKKWYGLPSFPLMQGVEYLCRDEAHFSMSEANAEKALVKCSIPALFIHGTEDDFVPPSHTIRNYRACASEYKDIVWIDGAAHAAAYYENTEQYQEAVRKLFRVCEEGGQ